MAVAERNLTWMAGGVGSKDAVSDGRAGMAVAVALRGAEMSERGR